ncbi:MAG TPA: hypothetical protein VF364_10585, partial [Candidatus Limnocylindria bacterium]
MPSKRRVRSLQIVGALTAIATAATVGASTAIAAAPTGPSLSEIHYDNAGTDTGEALEIDAPEGFDLSG